MESHNIEISLKMTCSYSSCCSQTAAEWDSYVVLFDSALVKGQGVRGQCKGRDGSNEVLIRPTYRPSSRCGPILWCCTVFIFKEHAPRPLPPGSVFWQQQTLRCSSEVREVWAEILTECRRNSRKTCITPRGDVRLLKLNKEGSPLSLPPRKRLIDLQKKSE